MSWIVSFIRITRVTNLTNPEISDWSKRFLQPKPVYISSNTYLIFKCLDYY